MEWVEAIGKYMGVWEFVGATYENNWQNTYLLVPFHITN